MFDCLFHRIGLEMVGLERIEANPMFGEDWIEQCAGLTSSGWRST